VSLNNEDKYTEYVKSDSRLSQCAYFETNLLMCIAPLVVLQVV
jgi:hypothetical protein